DHAQPGARRRIERPAPQHLDVAMPATDEDEMMSRYHFARAFSVHSVGPIYTWEIGSKHPWRNSLIHLVMQIWHDAHRSGAVCLCRTTTFSTLPAGDRRNRAMRRSRWSLAVGLFSLIGLAATSADALQINAVYDSSVTSRSDFAQIKSAFGQAADAWSNVLSDNVTVNIRVSWGSVGGYVLGNGTLGGSLDALYGYATDSQMSGWLSNDAST